MAGNTRVKVRRGRRQTPGKYRLKKAPWWDPFPWIPGTEPEKRVFAALYELKVYFIYQGQVPEFDRGGEYWQMRPPNYKPDFVLPEYRLIIDPFSPFHHSLEEAVERDVNKVVAYSVAGYAYYHPWAVGNGQWTWDQYHDSRRSLRIGKKTRIRLYGGVNAERNRYRNLSRKLGGTSMGTMDMLRSIPELKRGPLYKLTDPEDIKAKLAPGYRIGEYVGAGANSVAAANARRASAPALGIKVGTRRTVRRR